MSRINLTDNVIIQERCLQSRRDVENRCHNLNCRDLRKPPRSWRDLCNLDEISPISAISPRFAKATNVMTRSLQSCSSRQTRWDLATHVQILLLFFLKIEGIRKGKIYEKKGVGQGPFKSWLVQSLNSLFFFPPHIYTNWNFVAVAL